MINASGANRLVPGLKELATDSETPPLHRADCALRDGQADCGSTS
jgi:hypothetical protein